MRNITRLKQIRKRDNLIIILIISYNGHYNHIRDNKFITLKDHSKTNMEYIIKGEEIFKMTLPTPSTLEVDKFFMYKFSPSTS